MPAIDRQDRIFVAGHRGLVGSAIVRRLEQRGYTELVTRSRAELDLTRQADVEAFFRDNPVDVVVLAAAKVGGIHANDTRRAEFIGTNLQLQTNVIDAAYRSGTPRKLLDSGRHRLPTSWPAARETSDENLVGIGVTLQR